MKTFILSVLLGFFGLYGFAQRVIENPAFQATTSSNVVVTRIDLQDTCTVLHFKVSFPEGQSINLPKESYIQPAEGGEKLVVTRAEGAELVKPLDMGDDLGNQAHSNEELTKLFDRYLNK